MFKNKPSKTPTVDVLIIGILTLVISYGFASGTLAASRGRPLVVVFGYSLLTWGGYLLAHYYVTGRFIDPGSGVREFYLPTGLARRSGIAGGSCLLIIAVPIGIYGMYLDSLIVTGTGVTTFLIGYYISHYAMSGEIL